MLGQPGFAVLAAIVGVLAFNWPFPGLVAAQGDYSLFIYFFGAWAGAILVAFLISREVPDSDGQKGKSDA
ncbi:MAG TPA: hypothetical protein VFF03_05415 [Rhodocyclaceae bacterium]|nr:hypothetical protein [Rhodocyclaceae bacterium]